MKIDSSFADRSLIIRLTRSWLEMSQKEFVKPLNIHVVTLSVYESGQRKCSDKVWNRFVKVYRKDFENLLKKLDEFNLNKILKNGN